MRKTGNHTFGFIITGDEKGGVKAVQATRKQIQGLGRDTNRATKETKSFGAQISKISSKMAIATGAATVLTGAITTLANVQRTQAVRETVRMAEAFNTSVESMSEWGYVAERSGLSVEKMGDIFKDVGDRVGDFVKTGGGPLKDMVEQLGFDVEAIKNLAPDKQLLKIAESLDQLQSQSEKIFFLESIAGDAALLLPYLQNGAAGLHQMREEAKLLGISLNEVNAEQINQSALAIDRMESAFQGVGNHLTSQLAPAVTEFANDVTESIVHINQLLKEMDTAELEELVSLLTSIAGGAAVFSVLSKLNVSILGIGAAAVASATNIHSYLSSLNKTKIQTNVYGQVISKTSGKMNVMTKATRLLTVATRGLLGPIGLAIAAGYALYEAFDGEDLDDAAASASALADQIQKINTNSAGFKQVASNTKELEQVSEKVIMLSKTIALVEKGMQQIEPNSDAYQQASAGFVALQVELRKAHERQAELMQSSNDAANALFDFGDTTEGVVSSQEDLLKLTLEQQTAYENLLNSLNPYRKAIQDYDKDLETLNLALEKGIIDFNEYIRLVDKLSVKFNDVQLPEESPFNAYYEQLELLDQKLAQGMDFNAYFAQVEQLNAEFNNIKLPDIALPELNEFDDLIAKVESFGGAWSSAGSVIIDTFGSITDVLDNYSSQLQEIGKLEKEANKLREEHGEDHAGFIKANQKLEEARVKANISGIRSLTGAAASMFKESSKEREALHRLEMGFMVAEMAMSIEKSLLNATEAVTNAGTSGDPYTAPARVAAMIGIMAGVLGAVGIAFSSSSGSGVSAATRQEQQGTGTVFGDTSAKSESISKSFDRIVDLETDQYAELVKMNSNMRSLSSAITGVVVSLVRGNNFNGSNYNGFLGSKSNTDTNGLFEKIGDNLFGGIGGFAGGLLDSIIGGISKTKYELKDSGIEIAAQSLSSILNDGLQALYYNTIEKTKSKLWGLSKSKSTSTEYSELDNAVTEQLSSIFGLITDTALSAADVLGFNAELIEQRLKSISLDLTTISFKDLSGEEIQKELEAVLSSNSDLIAEKLVPELKAWQKVGEGAYETLTRVASEQSIFNQVLVQTEQSLDALNNVVSIDIAQNIIELAGGIEKLRDSAATYFSEFFTKAEQFEYLQTQLNAQFEALGFTLPATKEEFRALIKSLDLTTEAGQASYAALLNLSPALAAFFKQLKEGVEEAVDETLEQVKGLTDSLSSQITSVFGDQARLNSLNKLIQKERSLHDQRNRMYQRELQLQKALGDVKNNLLLGDLSTLSPEEKLKEARAQLDSATLENSESVIANYLNAAKLMYGAGEGYSKAFDEAMEIISRLQTAVIQEPDDSYIKALEAERDALKASIEAEASMRQLEQMFKQMIELGELDSDALSQLLTDLDSTPAAFNVLKGVIFKLYQDTEAFSDVELSNLDQLLETALGLEQVDISKLTDEQLSTYISSLASNLTSLTGIDTQTMSSWVGSILQLDDPDLTSSLLDLVNTKNQLDISPEQLERLNGIVSAIDGLKLSDATALDTLSIAITGLVDNAELQMNKLKELIQEASGEVLQPPVVPEPPSTIIRPIVKPEPITGPIDIGIPPPIDPGTVIPPPKYPPGLFPIGEPVLEDPIVEGAPPIARPIVPPTPPRYPPGVIPRPDHSPNNSDNRDIVAKLDELGESVLRVLNKESNLNTRRHQEAQSTSEKIAMNTHQAEHSKFRSYPP